MRFVPNNNFSCGFSWCFSCLFGGCCLTQLTLTVYEMRVSSIFNRVNAWRALRNPWTITLHHRTGCTGIRDFVVPEERYLNALELFVYTRSCAKISSVARNINWREKEREKTFKEALKNIYLKSRKNILRMLVAYMFIAEACEWTIAEKTNLADRLRSTMEDTADV